MNKKLNISSTVYPTKELPQDQWQKEYKFGSQYIEPPKLFQNNNHEGYTSRKKTFFTGIVKFLNKIG